MKWPEELQLREDRQIRARRRTGRFSTERDRATAERPEHSLRD